MKDKILNHIKNRVLFQVIDQVELKIIGQVVNYASKTLSTNHVASILRVHICLDLEIFVRI